MALALDSAWREVVVIRVSLINSQTSRLLGSLIIWALVLWRKRSTARIVDVLGAPHAHMYRLARADLEWILDADDPSESFPTLKNNELKEFGEYRTQRYALDAYDRIARGEPPDIPDSE